MSSSFLSRAHSQRFVACYAEQKTSLPRTVNCTSEFIGFNSRSIPHILHWSFSTCKFQALEETLSTDCFQLLIHCYKVMALCGDESIFFTYYPEESKSFCGRMIQEQIASGFTIKTHSSPRIHVLKRQTITSQSVPQLAQKNLAKQLQPEFDPTKPPPNWRTTSTPPTISTQAPPGFEQQPQTVQTPDQAPKPRRRRRHKKTNAELFEVLSESVDAPDIEDEKDA